MVAQQRVINARRPIDSMSSVEANVVSMRSDWARSFINSESD
jgi:hypothetical protein